jgi:IS4 transposase
LVGEKRYFLDSKLLNTFSDPVKEVRRVLKWLREHNIRIRVVLFDRGLTSSTLLRMLKSERAKYLGLCPKYENIKRIILDMEKTGKFVLRQDFNVKGVGTKLVIVREEKWDWTFVTNMEFKHAAKYIRLYRKRWNIETGFRVQDEARIKTKSTNPIIRYFYFLVSALLYNLWKLLDLGMPFKRLLIKFCEMWDGESEIWEPG